jgi:putative endonuclease
MGGWVYIIANKRNGTLYVGVTSHLAARISQHRAGTGSEFANSYKLKMLVYAEPHDSIEGAIRREKQIKNWTRARKIRLIEAANPEWNRHPATRSRDPRLGCCTSPAIGRRL